MPHLATLLELKTRVRLSTIPKRVLHRERRDGGQSHLLEGLIFEASCTYSKISPHPSLGVWAMSTAKKERGGGLILRRIWYFYATLIVVQVLVQ